MQDRTISEGEPDSGFYLALYDQTRSIKDGIYQLPPGSSMVGDSNMQGIRDARNARIQSPSVWSHLMGLLRNVVVSPDGEWRSLAHEKSMRVVGLAPEVGEIEVGEIAEVLV